MNRSTKRKKINAIMKINAVLLIILVICCYIYFQSNKDNDRTYGNEAENVIPGGDDTKSNHSNEQASDLTGEEPSSPKGEEPSTPITEEPSNPKDEETSGPVNEQSGNASNEGMTESRELALYANLPYFIGENSERYIKYKKKNPDYSYEQVITYVNIGLDYEFYEIVNLIDNGNDITVLVNKYNKLPDDYTPELVQLDQSMCAPGVGPQYLQKQAYEAFVKMHDDAKQLGLNITAYGTYRSIQTQHWIWNNAVNSGRTVEDVDSLNARGGHSEHHTGLAVDVIKNNYSVEESEEFKWYSVNAHKYGFIIRYPNGKEHITGYKYEPWHLRYVGPEIAKEVYERNITYDEYYVQVLQPEKKLRNIKQTP